MSLNSLLNPNTQKENWAIINPYRINTTEISAENLPSKYIINKDVLQLSDFTVLTGTGNIDAVTSVEEKAGDFIRLTGAVTISNFSAPASVDGSIYNAVLSLKLSGSSTYPDLLPALCPSSVSGQIKTPNGGALCYVDCVSARRDEIEFNVSTTANISAPDPARNVVVQFCLIYEQA